MDSREITAENTPRPGYTTTITYRATIDGPQAQSVAVHSKEHQVTSQVIREVKVLDLMKTDLQARPAMKIQGDPESISDEAWGRLARMGGAPVILTAAQQIYQRAEREGRPPAQAVAKALDISPSTAGRWIRRSKNELGWG
ncbi:hypothetical protein [Corynebacterium falsenii]|uniref:hypothetical protein n=1 Tax=Corynebacterium falsenii TaxID=108486 RepID=UPI001DF465CC|nr:hypothetical protein [Corynebacterium falsenii]HJF13065.1 hypothetical protein [Corynebacterium falsenii]